MWLCLHGRFESKNGAVFVLVGLKRRLSVLGVRPLILLTMARRVPSSSQWIQGSLDPHRQPNGNQLVFRRSMNLLVGTNALFLVALVVYVGIRNHFMTRLKYSEAEVNAIDTGDRVLVFFIALTVILLPAAYMLSPFFGFADYSVPLAIRSLGLIVVAISLWVFWRSHADLGTNWSPSLEVRKGHQLVTSGIYRRVRHPMYSSIWLWALGQAMTLPNWLIAWGPMICFSVMYLRRLPREERMMLDRFGSEYEAYMKVTGRLFPKFSK